MREIWRSAIMAVGLISNFGCRRETMPAPLNLSGNAMIATVRSDLRTTADFSMQDVHCAADFIVCQAFDDHARGREPAVATISRKPAAGAVSFHSRTIGHLSIRQTRRDELTATPVGCLSEDVMDCTG